MWFVENPPIKWAYQNKLIRCRSEFLKQRVQPRSQGLGAGRLETPGNEVGAGEG